MGSGSNGNPFTKYVIPGLETVGGGVSEYFAPGNPIGTSLMTSGIGQLAGGAAGGQSGQSIGGLLGGLGGGLGGTGSGTGLGSLLGGSASGLSDDDLTGILSAANPFGGTSAGLTDESSGIGAGSSPTAGGLLQGLGGLQGLGQLGGGALSMLGGQSQKGSQSAKPPQIVSAGPGPTPQVVPAQQQLQRGFTKGSSAAQLQALLRMLQG